MVNKGPDIYSNNSSTPADESTLDPFFYTTRPEYDL